MIHPTVNIWGECEIGDDTIIGAFCDIGCAKIGKNCKIQCHVSIPPGTIIEDNVFVGPGVRFANDKKPELGKKFVPHGSIVRKNAVIGMGALIGPGLEIGEGAVVGMGSVVTRNVLRAETVVGNPAHRL